MLKEIIIAFQSYGQAHRFILRHRLWKWIIIPGLIYLFLFVFGFYGFWKSSNFAIEWALQKSHVKNWLENAHDGLLFWLFIVGQVILRLLLLLFYFSLFKYLFLIIGSPVFAYLSEKTEAIIEQKEFPFSFKKLWNDIIRAIRVAVRNMLWQTVYVFTIIILSFIPVVGWIAPLISLFVECYYFGFSMLDYSCERNRMSAQEGTDFIGRHKGLAVGNGIVFYLMHLLPVLGWLFAPSYAVIAATLSLIQAKKKNVII
ncbi:MAG: EI24 domain-containing protein [Ferruginibacter sp.]|nr:EI24 domain-containing protein [Ferruginibacter sp.]